MDRGAHRGLEAHEPCCTHGRRRAVAGQTCDAGRDVGATQRRAGRWIFLRTFGRSMQRGRSSAME